MPLPQWPFAAPRCLKSWSHDKIIGLAVGGLMPALKPGDTAPDFDLAAVTGKQRHKFKLSEFRGGKNVVIAFYPLDWSPT
jgi:hypothetical protein